MHKNAHQKEYDFYCIPINNENQNKLVILGYNPRIGHWTGKQTACSFMLKMYSI